MNASAHQFGILDLLEVDRARPTRESLADHSALLCAADALGLDYLFVAERHFVLDQRAASANVLLAYLAATTTRARLGALAYTLPLHNAVLLAEEVSILDHLSGGRLDVGIGLGHIRDELMMMNVAVETRQARTRESLGLMHALWQGEPVTLHSEAYQITGARVDPPFQRPHPPIWYAGTDPTATTWAAGHGLNVALGFQPDDALQASADAFHRARLAERGTKLAVARRIFVAETDAQAKTAVIAFFTRQHGVHPLAAGSAERQYADRQAKQVMIAGGPEYVAHEIARKMARLNADLFLGIPSYATDDYTRARRTIDLFAEAVIPRVRELLDA